MNLFKRIREQAELAMIYLEDGAPHSAARVLQNLTDQVKQHAADSDRLVAALDDPSDPINLQGSGPAPIKPREG